MKVTKKFSEIQEGDIKIRNWNYYFLDFDIFPDISKCSKMSVKTRGCRMFPEGSYGRGSDYGWGWKKDDYDIEVITADEAKPIVEAYEELLVKNWELKELIFRQDAIPIVYTSDTTLNYPLKIGDVLLKRSFRYNDEVQILVIEDSKYTKAFDNIPQEEQFYEWLIESYKDYSVGIPGRVITVNNLWSQYHNDSSVNFYIGAYKTNCFLLEGVKNPKTTANKIRDMHNPFYNMLKDLYNKYYGDLKTEPQIHNWNYDPDMGK